MNTRQGFQESSFQDSSGSYLRRLRRLSFFTKAIHATTALMKHRKITSSQQVAEKSEFFQNQRLLPATFAIK